MLCRCKDPLGSDVPTRDDLLHALARSLEEIDAYRDMLGLPGLNCRRVFSQSDLVAGEILGLDVRIHDGALTCRPDS